MKRVCLLFLSLFLLVVQLDAQNVGLVLSGGGAKGIIHIGVIKALEENNIPIDYVTGTSIGAIVGSLYALGYSPDEMIQILKSESFTRWSTGTFATDEKYYYFSEDPRPSFVDLKFKVSTVDSLNIRANIIPVNFVSADQMNLAFVELYAQAAAVANYDFNKLFVPFRCVASDIYNKQAVVFSDGDLGDAVRASMTYPLMYRPIRVKGKLLFDGGIYNNFPVDIMRKDFKPRYIIGSIVGENPEEPSESNLMSQLSNMVINNTDYYIDPKEGKMLKFDLGNVNIFDFTRVDELVKIGYDSTLLKIPEIKEHLKRQVDSTTLAQKRFKFRKTLPPLEFENIIISGADSMQQQYLKRILQDKKGRIMMEDFRKKYFMLLSDNKIKEIIPHVVYNQKNEAFDLYLDVRIEDQLIAHVGGNISSSTSNQAYFGATYQNLSDYGMTANVDGQFGKIYNSIGISSRIDFPYRMPFYVKMTGLFHRFSYFEKTKWFYEENNTTLDFSQNETYIKLNVGFPVTMRGRLEFGLGYASLTDFYRLTEPVSPEDINNDKSRFSLGSAFARLENYALNTLNYPTSGYRYGASIQLIGGTETFIPSSGLNMQTYKQKDLWVQYHAQYDQYFPLSKKFILGTSADLTISTRKLLNNYTTTIIQAPSFAPTPHSKTAYNRSFSANQFAAVGLKPIYKLNGQFSFRWENYLFVPYKKISSDENGLAYYEEPTLKAAQFLSEASFVLDLRVISIAVFGNYYSSAVSKVNFGVNIGFLLFNKRFTE